MARRNAFKTNSSFFRMLAVGAVGAKAVQAALNARGHDIVELERGSLSTRIWRDVKRKRVRIPDLCCVRCGVRIESRAKTRPDLTMSHSRHDAERAWDYGMLDGDWIAFPILAADEAVWGEGLLAEQRSQWRERTRTSWSLVGTVNFFRVGELRSVAPKQHTPKGVTEGWEVQVSWKARFAKAAGTVTSVKSGRLDYRLQGETKGSHFRLGSDEQPFLGERDEFGENEVIAGQIRPLTNTVLRCTGECSEPEVARMLQSRERTVRFTGCKLARLRGYGGLTTVVRELANDPEEDPYVQMEARAYLCGVAGESADDQFRATLLTHADDQMRLEASVALAETHTPSSFDLLLLVLEDTRQPQFLRSACAWAIGCHGTTQAAECLVRAFGDVAPEIREEALSAVAELGAAGVDPLVKGLSDTPDVAAGSAEALRRLHGLAVEHIAALAGSSGGAWPTWTLAHLPKEAVVPHIAALQSKRPDVHFAVTVLWTFLESWIAENWTPRGTP
jgi:hypothetical protein